MNVDRMRRYNARKAEPRRPEVQVSTRWSTFTWTRGPAEPMSAAEFSAVLLRFASEIRSEQRIGEATARPDEPDESFWRGKL